MTEQTSDLSALWCTKCGKRVENNPYHQLGTPVYCQEHTYAATATLHTMRHYCQVCQGKGRLERTKYVAVLTSSRSGGFILLDYFCSEICALEWYDTMREQFKRDGLDYSYTVVTL